MVLKHAQHISCAWFQHTELVSRQYEVNEFISEVFIENFHGNFHATSFQEIFHL